MTDGLKDAHRSAIVDVLRANGRVGRAVLFGSRAMETFTQGSDVDIALFGEALTTADQARLAAAMAELTVPQRVDLLLYNQIEDAALRAHVRRDGIELYRRQENASAIRLDVPETHRRTLVSLLRQHLPDVEVWAYGSRINGRGHDGSDLDLALRGPGLEEIPSGRLADFEEALRGSTIPFLVEARDWTRLPKRFQREIEREHVVLVGRTRCVANDWQATTLGEHVTLIRETVHPSEAGVVPYIGLEHIGEGTLFLHSHGTAEEVTSAKSLFRRGDILFGKLRPYFRKVIQAPFDGVCSTDIWVFRPRDGVDQKFLKYLLAQNRFCEFVTAGSTGTRMPRADWAHARDFQFHLPLLSEQRAIAHILGTLDDRIELNRRMNETQEVMAHALFKSWFVDFDPVRARMEGHDTGLPQDIADLFPDRLVQSELGEIPEGWTLGTLGDIATSPRMGIDPTRVASDMPYIGLEHMPRKSVALMDWGNAGSVSSNKCAFENPDVLFGKLRPYFHKVGIAPVKGVCSTDIVVLRARMPRWSAFVLACVSSSAFVSHASQASTGTKMPRTNWRTMSEYELCRPDDTIAATFQHIVSPMVDRIVTNVHASRTLAALRDALLPKLISGEIRLRTAEMAVDADAVGALGYGTSP